MSDFITAWENLFGVYTPIVTTDSDMLPLFSSIDWGYVGRVAYFSILTICLFKFLGGLFKDGKR